MNCWSFLRSFSFKVSLLFFFILDRFLNHSKYYINCECTFVLQAYRRVYTRSQVLTLWRIDERNPTPPSLSRDCERVSFVQQGQVSVWRGMCRYLQSDWGRGGVRDSLIAMAISGTFVCKPNLELSRVWFPLWQMPEESFGTAFFFKYLFHFYVNIGSEKADKVMMCTRCSCIFLNNKICF